MNDTPDHHLLKDFCAGDQEALAVLVARHLGLVRAACQRQAPAGDADDCVQAVFLVLSRRPASAARAPAMAAWLLRVAWFVCRRAQRAARRRRQAESRAATTATRSTAGRPEAIEHLDDCLAKLPERQRAAISLHYLAGRSVDEVATALDVSRDNAYQLLSRGVAALRGLPARRGIVIAAPALLALMAGECQAATAAATTSTIALSLSATPSAGASTLAQGAITAMIINSLAPVAVIAASLILSACIAATMHAADAAIPPTAQESRPAAALTNLDKALDAPITVDFRNVGLDQAINLLRKISGVDITIDPNVTAPPITLKVEKAKLRDVLNFVTKIAGVEYRVQNGAIVIGMPAAAKAAVPAGF